MESVDLSYYIDNSEWALTALYFRPTQRRHFDSDIPELVYVLRMRRRAFYYVFNIIVPCLMLSVLTLLTFWLPSTSGEKISLGLSVFLTFSMFMLLIAEEVPATSESVPLIGRSTVHSTPIIQLIFNLLWRTAFKIVRLW